MMLSNFDQSFPIGKHYKMLNFEAGWSFRRIKRIDSTDTSAQNAVGGRT